MVPSKRWKPWAALALAAALAALGLLWGVAVPAPSATASTPDAAPRPGGGMASRPAPDRAPVPLGALAPAGPMDAGAQEIGFHASWGAGLGQLGRDLPEEGNPEAPMSLAIGPNGAAWVLDQVNGRLVRFGPDGRALEALPVTQQAPQDVAVAADGTALVLDRLRDKSVAILKDGRLQGELPVEGKGVEEGGGVTGVFVDGKDVYVEYEHGSLVRVGDTDGRADPERPEVPGRPSRDGGSYLLAGIVDPAAGRLFVNAVDRASGERRFTRELRMGGPVATIVLLDSDLAGTIYLATLLAPGEGMGASIRLLCLAPQDGAPRGSADLPVSAGPEETFRELVALDGGGVLYAQRGESGVSFVRYDCR